MLQSDWKRDFQDFRNMRICAFSCSSDFVVTHVASADLLRTPRRSTWVKMLNPRRKCNYIDLEGPQCNYLNLSTDYANLPFSKDGYAITWKSFCILFLPINTLLHYIVITKFLEEQKSLQILPVFYTKTVLIQLRFPEFLNGIKSLKQQFQSVLTTVQSVSSSFTSFAPFWYSKMTDSESVQQISQVTSTDANLTISPTEI